MRRGECMAWTLIVVLLFLSSCSSTHFTRYSKDMFEGRQFYGITDYASARSSFLRASLEDRTPMSLAWAAASSYRMGDREAAERLVREAQAVDSGSISSLRIHGYKALILLGADRKQEGIEALREYVDIYGRFDPLTSIEEVKRMAASGNIDLPRLQLLIDEQVCSYESDMEQLYSTRTGFYGNKWETRAVPGFNAQ